MTAHAKCPLCGQLTPLTPAVMGRYLSPMQGRIYDMVRAAMPEGISANAIYDRLYAHRPFSGDVKVVHVTVRQMNARLARWGLMVRAGSGGTRKYRLLPILRQGAPPALPVPFEASQPTRHA